MHPSDVSAMSLSTLGDVLRRSAPLVSIDGDESVVTLARVLHEKRVDAVVILHGNTLAGLVTSRDVAACIARAEHLDDVPVSQIMTTNPVSLSAHESPARALAIMRSGRFRHIPVVAPNGDVMGVVDVLNLAYDAITRLQLSYSMIPSRRSFDFMRAAKASIEKPTLRPIVETSPLVTLSRENTVTEACEAIVKHHLAAVVIVDENGVLDGIFTCRDATTRVVAKHKDPNVVTLAQVMTQSPDCASPDYTILESLQRMQACGFRHLPVVEDHSRKVVGLVNVLQLASDALLDVDAADSNSYKARDTANYRRSTSTGLASFFSSLFSSTSYAQPAPPPPRPPPPPSQPSAVPISGRQFSTLSRRELLLSSTAPSSEAACATFKFRDINNEYRRVRVPFEVEPGAFDNFVINVRRRFMGSSSTSGPVKLKYVDEDGDEVLMSNDEDLASCLEEFSNSKGKTIQLKVYEAERRASGHVPSPVSSRSNSVVGSPRGSLVSPSSGPSVPARGTPAFAPLSSASSVSGHSEAKTAELTPSALKAQDAHTKMMDGDVQEAIALFNDAIALDSGNARALGGRGAAHLINGNSTGAEEDYRAAIALLDEGKGGKVGDPTFEMCTFGLVEALIDQRRYEEAVHVAGRLDPENGSAKSAFRDELESASAAARTALEANEFGDAMSMYSNALRVESAYLELTTEELPRASLRVGRAKCYKMLEDYDMALEDYEAAIKLEPESVAGHKGCAKCLAELEQMDRALEAYERAHKLDPADDEVNREIKLLKEMLPDPLAEKKNEIAKLGAMLGTMKFATAKRT